MTKNYVKIGVNLTTKQFEWLKEHKKVSGNTPQAIIRMMLDIYIKLGETENDK